MSKFGDAMRRIAVDGPPEMETVTISRAEYEALIAAASKATIAWACCASIHRVYAKRKDPFYTTRQADFVKHEETARAALRAAGHLPTPPSEDKT